MLAAQLILENSIASSEEPSPNCERSEILSFLRRSDKEVLYLHKQNQPKK